MDKKQEEKICEWCKRGKRGLNGHDHAYTTSTAIKAVWQACLDANGIESQDDKPYRVYVFKNMNDMKQFTKDRIEPDNPFYDTSLGEPYREPINDLAKTFEAIAFAMTDASNKITAAVNAGIDRANAEVINAEAKEWTPKEGDAVFTYNGTVRVGRVKLIGDSLTGKIVYVFETENAETIESFLIGAVKPFNPSAIGKPWSEI